MADELESYRSRRLAPPDLLRVDDHLAACEVCQARLAGLVPVGGIAQPWRESLGEGATRRLPIRILAIAAAVVVCVVLFRIQQRPPLIARLQDGGTEVTLDGAGRLSGIGGLTPGQERAIRAALQESRLGAPPWVASLIGRREVLMGSGGGAFNPVLAPVGTAVLEDRPRFRWRSVPGAASYVVIVQDETTGRSIRSEPLVTMEWTPSQPLERGRRYSWQLAARQAAYPAPPDPPARFQVVDHDAAARLTSLPGSHLLRSVSYAEAGLLDAAQLELEALARQNPDSTPVRACLDALLRLRRPE